MNELNQLMMAEQSVFTDMGGGKPTWFSVFLSDLGFWTHCVQNPTGISFVAGTAGNRVPDLD